MAHWLLKIILSIKNHPKQELGFIQMCYRISIECYPRREALALKITKTDDT